MMLTQRHMLLGQFVAGRCQFHRYKATFPIVSAATSQSNQCLLIFASLR